MEGRYIMGERNYIAEYSALLPLSCSPVMPITGAKLVNPSPGSIVKQLFTSINQNGKSTYMIDEKRGKEYSYDELFRRSCSIAVKLKSLGVGKNVVVSLLANNCVESQSFQVGTWFSEGIASPVNFNLTTDEIRQMLLVCRPTIIFCENQYLKLTENAIKGIGWDITLVTCSPCSSYLSYDDFINEDISNFDVKIDDPTNHIYYVLFTSGTTGVPKGVKLRDEAGLINAMGIDWASDSNRLLLTSPNFWISNGMVVTTAILNKKTIVLPAKSDAESILRSITKLKPNAWFTGSAILLEMCAIPNIHEYDTSSLSRILIGGSRIALEQKNMIREKVFDNRNIIKNIYGSTEAGLLTIWDDHVPVDSPEYDSIGKLAPGIILKVVDITTGKELGPNQEGEFWFKSQSFMGGYMNKNFVNTDLDADGWWHIGDVGYYDERGFIYYVSRMKDILKFRGVQIAPIEIETVFLKHPDVLEVCVVGKPHDIDGDWPTAFIVKRPESPTNEEEIKQFAEGQLPDVKKLRGGVHFISGLPRSAVGKILKGELLKMFM